MHNSTISAKSVNRARPLKLLRSLKFFQHRVFLSSVIRAAFWSSRFKKFYHVSLGHTTGHTCMSSLRHIIDEQNYKIMTTKKLAQMPVYFRELNVAQVITATRSE